MTSLSCHGARTRPRVFLLAALFAGGVAAYSQIDAAPATRINAPTSAVTTSVQRIGELRASDAGAAIAQAEPLFGVAQDSERVALGMELAAAYLSAHRAKDAQGLLDKLVGNATVTDADRAMLLGLRLEAATAQHDWKEVDVLAKKAESVASVTADQEVPARLWSRLGLARLGELRFDDAEAAYERALEKFHEYERVSIANNDKQGMAVSARNIGETLIRLDQREEAIAPLQRAYELYAETDQRPKRLELYPAMIENLEVLGRPAEALKLMHEFKSISDEVVDVESRESISRLESDVDLAQKQKQLLASERDSLAKTAEIADLEAKQALQQLLSWGLLIGLIALIVLLLMQVRERRVIARAHRELRIKNELIESQRRDLKGLNEVIRRRSLEDVLTGLKNRRFLSEWLTCAGRATADQATADQATADQATADQATADPETADPETARAAENEGAQTPSVVILIDLDHFKSINDRLGHAAGDLVLAEFADTLRSCARESDILVRWGGEEFIWLCVDTPARDAPTLCERVRSALKAHPIIFDGTDIALTASMGFASCPMWDELPADWKLSMRIADTALYQAKSSGRDRWVGFESGRTPESAIATRGNPLVLERSGHLVRVVGPN